jgi:hypothetical protein
VERWSAAIIESGEESKIRRSGKTETYTRMLLLRGIEDERASKREGERRRGKDYSGHRGRVRGMRVSEASRDAEW